jgi:hypothetical protein
MPIKSVWLGLNFEEAPLNNAKESYTAAIYAVELWARERAHLSVFLVHRDGERFTPDQLDVGDADGEYDGRGSQPVGPLVKSS